MASYLMMLYVTLDQESALKNFFSDQGWTFSKPDLSVTTDKLGPSIGNAQANLNKDDKDPKCTPAVPGIKRKAKATQRKAQKIKLAKILPSSSDLKNSTERVSRKTQEDTDVNGRLDENTGVLNEMTMGQYDVEEVGNMKMKKMKGKSSDDTAEQNHDVADNDDVGDDENDETDMIEDINDGDNEEKLDGSNVSNKYPRRLPSIGKFKKGGKKRQYNPQLLALAYEDVLKGTSIHRAAKIYGIPDSTLRDKFRGPMQPAPEGERFNVNPGPTTTLSLKEENELVDHCTYMDSIGYGYSRNELISLASDFAISLKKKSVSSPPFSQAWFDGFRIRHPEILVTLSKPQKLALVRAKCTSEEVLDRYFLELKEVLEANQLMDKPENVWNVDETGLLMEHSPSNVICQEGTTPQAVTSNRGKTVTIIAAGSAVGSRIPPFYVFPGKRWNGSLLNGACPDAAGTVSVTGGLNSLVFLKYLEKHFLKHVPNNTSPILILFDGHKSHVNLTMKEWGEAHNLVFFVIPPHTSHVTQPLDVGCFGPLKRVYNSECQAFMRRTPGIQINRMNVAEISSVAYNKVMTPDNLISSFRKSGIFSLDRNQITPYKTAPSTIYPTQSTETSNNETN